MVWCQKNTYEFFLQPPDAILPPMSTPLRVTLALSILLILVGVGVYASVFLTQSDTTPPDVVYALPADPLNATYRIEGVEVSLEDGRAQTEVAPSSAEIITTEVVGELVPLATTQGAANAVLLRQDLGGTGSFYYLALAVSNGDGFLGSEAVYLGDRIEEVTVQPWGELMWVSYGTRATSTSFAEPADVPVTRYFYTRGATLLEHGPFELSVRGYAGSVLESARGYVFDSCEHGRYLLASSSPAYGALQAIYAQRSGGGGTFMQLALRGVDSVALNDVVVVEAVLAAPEDFLCTDVARVSAVTDTVATTSRATSSLEQ